jgi:hypothetical protein
MFPASTSRPLQPFGGARSGTGAALHCCAAVRAFGDHMTFVRGECLPLYSLAIIGRVQSCCASGVKMSDGSYVNGNSHMAQETQ